MTKRPNLRVPLLVAALAASMASAWATYELQSSTYVPVVKSEAPAADLGLSLSPNETVVTADDVAPAKEVEIAIPARPTAIVPVAEAQTEESITITKPRLTEDQRIQAEVMERLATNPRLTGKIGVESADSVVRLSGYLMTSGQVWHAERDARSVRGVRHVVNEIRPRVGAITS
jgi:hypothetical protein